MHPRFDIGADAARSVHQHHDGEAPRALRDAKFAGDGDGFAIGIAGQELLVGYGQRPDGMDLDPRRDFLRHRLRVGFNPCQQDGGAKNPGRDGRTHAASHHAPLRFLFLRFEQE